MILYTVIVGHPELLSEQPPKSWPTRSTVTSASIRKVGITFSLPSRTQGSRYMLETRKPLYSNCLDLHIFKGCPLLTCCSKSQDLRNCDYQQFQPRKWKDGPLHISAFQLLHSTSNDHNLAHIQKLQHNGLNGGPPKDMSTQNLRMWHYLQKGFLQK